MTTDEKIIDKIRKLLALSKDKNSVEEASSAWQKAQELLLKYNVSLAEIEKKEAKGKEYVIQLVTLPSNRQWRIALMRTLASNFLCECLSQRRYVVLVGQQHNIDVVLEMFAFIAPQLERLAELSFAMRGYGNRGTWKTDFYNGANDTIQERFRAQTSQTSEVTALIVANTDELRKYVEEHFHIRYTTSYVRASPAYAEGRIKGNHVTLRHELS